jgi:hypothetical protein
VAPDEPHDPPAHRGEQARHLDIGRRHRRRNESLRAVGLFFEDTLGYQGVEMYVGVQGRPAALNCGHGTTAALASLCSCPAPLETEQCSHEHRQNIAAQAMVVGELVAQPMRQRQNPLADGQVAEDAFDEVGGGNPTFRTVPQASPKPRAASAKAPRETLNPIGELGTLH